MRLNELKIEITNHCLLNCVHCSTEAGINLNTTFSDELIERLLFEAAELGCNHFYFSGGEPLLIKNISKHIRKVSQKDSIIKVYTSGIVSLNPPTPISEEKIQDLYESGVTHLVFSLYSSKPNIHDRITRVKGSFCATVAAIKSAVLAGIYTEVHFVVLKPLLNELKNLTEFISSIGVKQLSILRFVPQGRGIDSSDRLTPDKADYVVLRKLINKLRECYANLVIRTGSPFNFLILGNATPCTTGRDKLIIDPNGYAYPCDALKQVKSYNTNNNIYSDSLKSIIENASLFKLVQNKEYPNVCIKCEYFGLCKSGCIAQRILSSDKFNVIRDPSCIKKLIS
ncbi:MAG: radical SAM protein [Pseudomonadota bacterium]